MKNKEKYFDEICESLAWNIACDFKHKYIKDRICCVKDGCNFSGDCSLCCTEFNKWLKEECSKLTDDEYVILKNMKYFKWIVRSADGKLYMYETQPYRAYDLEWNNDGVDFGCYSHLFQFIKLNDKEPCCIHDLLLEYEIYRNIKPNGLSDDEWKKLKELKQQED